jgi:hypothetical protein
MALVHNTNPIVLNGLVLALDAANIKSYSGLGTNLTDLSGRGNNGTLVTGVGYTSDNGGSFSFDGSNDYINTVFTYQNSSDFTMSCWIKTSIPNQKCGLIGIRSSDTAGINWYLAQVYISGDINVGTSGNNIVFNNYYGGGGAGAINRSVIANTINVTDGNWRHIVVNSNSTVSKIYIDGILVATSSVTASPTRVGPAPLLIGAAGNYPSAPVAGFYYNGQISNVCFYSRELSAAEVLQNYNTLKGRYV